MKYLIICKNQTAFYTDWYDYENFYNESIYAIVNRVAHKISFDGKTWEDIEEDLL